MGTAWRWFENGALSGDGFKMERTEVQLARLAPICAMFAPMFAARWSMRVASATLVVRAVCHFYFCVTNTHSHGPRSLASISSAVPRTTNLRLRGCGLASTVLLVLVVLVL
eukprot:COSAG01_NODE_853_length_13097_cov_45.939529_1_plen_110_part_10